MSADPASAAGLRAHPTPSQAPGAPPGPAKQKTPGLARALAACREGSWRNGLARLSDIARRTEPSVVLPGVFYSFLGVAVSRCEGRKRDGVDLCRYAVKLEPRRAENHLNLASAYLMARNRRAAVRALRRGLRLAPQHTELLEFAAEMGVRRRPVIPFLPRSMGVNRLLGRLRHRLILKLLSRREEEL